MDTLYRMDIDSKPPKKPFKPFITPPHRRFRGSFDKGRGGRGGRFGQFGQSDRRNRFTRNRIGTVYPNIPLSSASLHGHPRSSLGATLGVRMS